MRKRTPPTMRVGIVSMATRMAANVVPQMTQIAAKASVRADAAVARLGAQGRGTGGGRPLHQGRVGERP